MGGHDLGCELGHAIGFHDRFREFRFWTQLLVILTMTRDYDCFPGEFGGVKDQIARLSTPRKSSSLITRKADDTRNTIACQKRPRSGNLKRQVALYQTT